MSSVSKLASRCLVLGCVLLAACGSDPAGPAGPGPDASVAADAAPASDAAASITGAVLPIEGGWTAH